MAACRFCGALLDEKHRSGLFSTIALEKDLPGRFSRLLRLPVSRDDGLSVYCCRKCVGKLNSTEKIEEINLLQTPVTARLAMLLLLTPAHYPGNALEKESKTRAVTQLRLTLHWLVP